MSATGSVGNLCLPRLSQLFETNLEEIRFPTSLKDQHPVHLHRSPKEAEAPYFLVALQLFCTEEGSSPSQYPLCLILNSQQWMKKLKKRKQGVLSSFVVLSAFVKSLRTLFLFH